MRSYRAADPHGSRISGERRNLSALSVLFERRDPGWRDGIQMRSADSRSIESRAAVARSRAGRDRFHRVRPFAVPARNENRRARELVSRVGRHRIARTAPADRLDRSATPRPQFGANRAMACRGPRTFAGSRRTQGCSSSRRGRADTASSTLRSGLPRGPRAFWDSKAARASWRQARTRTW